MKESLAAALANIQLPDTEGQQIRLGSLWEQNSAVVVFLRHYGCIFCREHIGTLREHESAFHERGARLAAVGLGTMEYAQMFRQDAGISFPLLVDEQRVAYRAAGLKVGNVLHLLRRDNAERRASAREAGYRHHPLGKNPFQLGGSFVFGPGNVDRYMHLSKTFGDNAPWESLLEALP